MSAAAPNVVQLASRQAVDEAWRALCDHRRRLLEEGVAPLLDRDWVEEDARLNARFHRLFMFMINEPPCDVVKLERRT